MKSERLFKSVLEHELSSGTPENDNKVVSVSLKLASVYARWGRDEQAEMGYKFCIGHQQKKVKSGKSESELKLR